MEDVRDLKALQIDALREVANIGAGHAATALSQLTNRRIMISVPQINIARLEEVPDLLGDPQEVVAAVLMHMLGDLTGRTLLLFPEGVARKLCDMLLRRPSGTTTVFDVLEQSCLKEAGNILSGAYMRSEEHTSELQSLAYLVCRLLLEKKKKNIRLHCVGRAGELYHWTGRREPLTTAATRRQRAHLKRLRQGALQHADCRS